MFTIVHPIATKSKSSAETIDLHLVSFCKANTDVLPKNTPLLFIYSNDQTPPVIIRDGKFVKGIGKYYQIFASTDSSLGVPPPSNSFMKKYAQDYRDMEEVLLYWEQKDGKWVPFVHPRKGHVIINSLEKAPQVDQMVYFPPDTFDGFFPIIETIKVDNPEVNLLHQYGVKFDNPSDFLDYHVLLQTSKSFHP